MMKMKLKYTRSIIIILIIIFGITLEYADEFIITTSSGPAPDVFPSQISYWDSRLLLYVNPGFLNPSLNIFLGLFTHLGGTLAIVFFGIILYLMGYRREGVLVIASVIIGTVFTAPIKIIVNRPRPYFTLNKVVPLETETGSSFPSGHSMRAFTLASVLSSSRTLEIILYLYAFIIAFSRIYIGVHYPLDVIVGGIIGWITGKITLKLENKILIFSNKIGF